MDFVRTGIFQEFDDWTSGITAYNGVIDHDHPLPQHIFIDHVKLFRHPRLRSESVGSMNVRPT